MLNAKVLGISKKNILFRYKRNMDKRKKTFFVFRQQLECVIIPTHESRDIMEEQMLRRLEATIVRLEEIDRLLMDEAVTSDRHRYRDLSKERANIEPIVEKYEEYKKVVSNREDALLMSNDSDAEIAQMGKEEFKKLSEREEELMNELRILMIPKDPNDDKNIVVEIRGAVGGDEADLFAADLFRMYTRYAESQGWKIQMIDENSSGLGGFSMVSFMIKGDGVYSKLKFESGAHRVQRVPKTESQGRIHTSVATVLVMPEAEEVDVVINPNDLQIDTYRSQGAGGQNVNKTESAVRITHIPTGIVVACQVEKSQIQNREIAMNLLRARVLAAKVAEQEEKIGAERKLKVGTGERSEKIRTYNYPQNRVTDHRIGLTIQKLDRIMEGELSEIIEALIYADQQEKLAEGIQ